MLLDDAIKEGVLHDIIPLYEVRFSEQYHIDKRGLLEMIGMERAQRVSDVVRWLQKRINQIDRGDTSYFDQNSNLIAIIRSEEDQRSQIIRSRKIDEAREVISILTLAGNIRYVLMYQS